MPGDRREARRGSELARRRRPSLGTVGGGVNDGRFVLHGFDGMQPAFQAKSSPDRTAPGSLALMSTPEQLAKDTNAVIADAILEGRVEVASQLLLDAFVDPRLGEALAPENVLLHLLALWGRSPVEARRAYAGFEKWREGAGELRGWTRGWHALLRTLDVLPDEFPVAILAMISDALLHSELIEIRPRLRRFAWENPEQAQLAFSLLPEPDPLAELLGRSGNALRDLIGESLSVPQRGHRPLAPEQAIARARALIESADSEHLRVHAWRALHDLLLEQTPKTCAAVVDAIEPLLSSWPDSQRVTLCASPWDFDIVTGVEDPAHRLIRHLHYNWMFISRSGKIMIRNPRLDSKDGLRLARSPSARWLTQINLGQQRLGPEVAEALARSDKFEALERLSLNGCNLETRGLVALARGRFPSLTHLELSNNDAGPEAAQAWGEFLRERGTGLCLLALSSNPIGEGVADVAAAEIAELQLLECGLGPALPEFSAIRLGLARNELGPELRLAAPRLRELSLAQVGLGDRGLAALDLPELERIDVEGNEISATGLAQASVIAHAWDLRNNPIGDAGFALALARPSCRRLTARGCGLSAECFIGAPLEAIESLDLLDNEIAHVRALARARALRELTVGGVSLGDISEDWPPLESLSVFGPLDDDRLPAVLPSRRLWLNECLLDDRRLSQLLADPTWRPETLAIAAVSGSGDDLQALGRLGDAAVIELAGSPIAERLTTLRLPGHRGITSEGLIALARSPYLARLERLILSHCSIDDAGILEFLRARPQVLLDVEGNPYGEQVGEMLESVEKC